MGPEMIRRALMNLRGQGTDATSAPMQAAPSAQVPGLSDAYAQSPTAALQQQNTPSFQFDPQLENQVNAQGGNNQLEPIIQQIMQRLGVMNMIRNRSNQTMSQG